MQTKLTLRLEERLVVRAKAWARKRGVSLSQAVATIFEQLPNPPERELSSWTRQLIGRARPSKKGVPLSDEAIRRDRLNHLEKKHR